MEQVFNRVGEFERELSTHRGPVSGLTVLGPNIWSCGRDGLICLWGKQHGEFRKEIAIEGAHITAICSTDTSCVVVTTAGEVLLWNELGELKTRTSSGKTQCNSVLWQPGTRELWIGCSDGSVLIMNEALETRKELKVGKDAVSTLLLLLGSDAVLVGCLDGSLAVFSEQGEPFHCTFAEKPVGVTSAVQVSASELWLGLRNGTIHQVGTRQSGNDVELGVRSTWKAHMNKVASMIVVGEEVWTGGWDGSVRIWNNVANDTPTFQRAFPLCCGMVNKLLYLREECTVWEANNEGRIFIWEAVRNRELVEEHESLLEQLTETQQTTMDLTRRIGTLVDLNESLTSRLNSTDQGHQRLLHQYGQLKLSQQELTGEYETLQKVSREMKEFSTKTDNDFDYILRVWNEMETLLHEQGSFAAQLDDTALKQLDAVLVENRNYEQKLTALHNEYGELQSDRNAWKQKYLDLVAAQEQQQETFSSKHESVQRELDELKQQHEQVQEHHQQAMSELEHNLDQYRQNYASLQEELHSSQNQIQSQEARIEQLQSELDRVREELQQEQQSHKSQAHQADILGSSAPTASYMTDDAVHQEVSTPDSTIVHGGAAELEELEEAPPMTVEDAVTQQSSHTHSHTVSQPPQPVAVVLTVADSVAEQSSRQPQPSSSEGDRSLLEYERELKELRNQLEQVTQQKSNVELTKKEVLTVLLSQLQDETQYYVELDHLTDALTKGLEEMDSQVDHAELIEEAQAAIANVQVELNQTKEQFNKAVQENRILRAQNKRLQQNSIYAPESFDDSASTIQDPTVEFSQARSRARSFTYSYLLKEKEQQQQRETSSPSSMHSDSRLAGRPPTAGDSSSSPPPVPSYLLPEVNGKKTEQAATTVEETVGSARQVSISPKTEHISHAPKSFESSSFGVAKELHVSIGSPSSSSGGKESGIELRRAAQIAQLQQELADSHRDVIVLQEELAQVRETLRRTKNESTELLEKVEIANKARGWFEEGKRRAEIELKDLKSYLDSELKAKAGLEKTKKALESLVDELRRKVETEVKTKAELRADIRKCEARAEHLKQVCLVHGFSFDSEQDSERLASVSAHALSESELQHEVIHLRTESVKKDRQLRQLRSDNQNLSIVLDQLRDRYVALNTQRHSKQQQRSSADQLLHSTLLVGSPDSFRSTREPNGSTAPPPDISSADVQDLRHRLEVEHQLRLDGEKEIQKLEQMLSARDALLPNTSMTSADEHSPDITVLQRLASVDSSVSRVSRRSLSRSRTPNRSRSRSPRSQQRIDNSRLESSALSDVVQELADETEDKEQMEAENRVLHSALRELELKLQAAEEDKRGLEAQLQSIEDHPTGLQEEIVRLRQKLDQEERARHRLVLLFTELTGLVQDVDRKLQVEAATRADLSGTKSSLRDTLSAIQEQFGQWSSSDALHQSSASELEDLVHSVVSSSGK